ncbi:MULTISPECIES: glycosyltransferase family 4 protein [unclassified Coleofasciculus]|uniref:glycosyltransferase family 4 protein n=1 Tax=unclassified Coleofasciculus TaxID=2692782 RepID=UPI00187F1DAB|nr:MULTISPECIES: glycosyltransferase family 4 protein [unclassified Coleofasciculus]MBE9126897.1 glycosyltransferase family 4 protein [Coleofasciculus sp. LEGE 07081]MBE9150207.1 glycosyltransferase family 4 protein [Coleofasciculus sp. LEGE 07092]
MDNLRIAWLVPSVELGAYWQPVLAEFSKVFKNTIFYTGQVWPEFDPQAPGANLIQVVGEMKSIETTQTVTGYNRRFMYLSPGIVSHLLRFKPNVIFAQAFSLWTLLALLLKPLGRWQFIIIYDGSSPNSDFQDSKLRSLLRRLMTRFADAFVANSYGAKAYLIEALGAKEDRVFTKTYLVPDARTLLQNLEQTQLANLQFKRPIFLYVGRITSRKGLKPLLEACSVLKTEGYRDYTLLIIGKGEQREELETFVKDKGLENTVTWIGWVEYGYLGAYFQQTDVFVFPTFEDLWGMVALEAMVFGKPVLCSKWAGAAEMVVEGENGYIFDPYHPQELAVLMRRFLDHPDLITSMGERSQQLIAQTTPQTAAQSFVEVI